jgi:hypothetical protein
LIVACIRLDGRSFSSVDTSHTFSPVIAVAVTIVAVVAVVAVVAAPVSTLLATAVASTAASVVVVFTPAPPWETAVRRVALTPSFSVAVVRIFSLSAASPSRPRIFATVAPPLPLLLV